MICVYNYTASGRLEQIFRERVREGTVYSQCQGHNKVMDT